MFYSSLKHIWILLFSFNALALALKTSNLEVEYFHISQWKVNNFFGKAVIGDVAYDELGHIILATSDGVKTFNGIDFADYYHYDSTPNSISFAKIQLAQESVWAANSFGLFKLDSNKMTEFQLPLSYNTYSSFAITGNGSVWFISNFSLFKIDEINSQPSQIFNKESTSIHIPNQGGHVFIGSKGFVYELDSKEQVISEIPLINSELIVISLYLTKSEILLINTNKGAYKYNTKTKVMSPKPIPVLARMVLEDSHGQIWFGTNKGIFLYKDNQLKQINLANNEDLRIRGITEDGYGNIWFGTWGEGLFRLKQIPFGFLKTNVNPTSYIETSNNDKWIGGYDGLSVIHAGDVIKPVVVGIKNSFVHDIEEGVDNTVWVAFKTNLVKFDASGENPKIIAGIDAFFYKFLETDSDGNLWVGTEKGLFYKKLGTHDEFRKLVFPNNEKISTLLLLKEKQILMVTEHTSYIYANGNFHQNNMTKNLQQSNLVIAYDRESDVVWSYDPKDNQLVKTNNKETESYFLDDVLTHFSFYSIETTVENDVVLLGESGVLRIKKKWISDYTEKQPLFFEMLAMPGLNQNECNGGHNSISKNIDSKTFFTCKIGILSLDSLEPNSSIVSQDMNVSIEVDGSKMPVGSALLSLPPSGESYHFTFDKESLDELLPLDYRYRLLGVDKHWNYVSSGNKKAVVYANLKPKVYEFEAQVKNTRSNWVGGSGHIIHFKINPYFYQKSWFIILVGLVLVLLYYINDYFRNIRHRKVTKKLSKLVEEKTQSLKNIQKRELQRELQSREKLNAKVKEKSGELDQQLLLMLEKEKQLRETQKMEVVGQLTSGIAHDFNNMLSIIFIGSDVIKKDLEKSGIDQKDNIKWLNNILLTAENCREVIGQLLKFTRKDSQQHQVFGVNQALSEIVSLLKVGIPDTFDFTVNMSNEVTFIDADISQFNQIILNLIINARKACGDYGEIIVTTKNIESSSTNCTCCGQKIKGKYAEITISDTGEGIPDHLIQEIFQPFFSISVDDESTGIGLHIVNSNVHKMKGHVQAFANENKGMSFKILLPLVTNVPVKLENINAIIKTTKKVKHVLLVEDSASLVDLIGLIFDENHTSYDVGRNGLEGLELFYANPAKYDLILTDNSMPEMNGIDMSKRILSVLPKMNIVLLTGHINDSTVQECKDIGIKEIFLKPIKSDELINLINSYAK